LKFQRVEREVVASVLPVSSVGTNIAVHIDRTRQTCSNTVQRALLDEWRVKMEGPLRGILAGAAAWKFGGGCISTVLIFIIVFWLLGYVNC
jgi:hypothetical protein